MDAIGAMHSSQQESRWRIVDEEALASEALARQHIAARRAIAQRAMMAALGLGVAVASTPVAAGVPLVPSPPRAAGRVAESPSSVDVEAIEKERRFAALLKSDAREAAVGARLRSAEQAAGDARGLVARIRGQRNVKTS